MDINYRLQKFGQSLEEASDKECRKLEKEVDEEIKQGIEQEVKEYENKKQINYEKTIQRIEKEYNKKVYNYEINCKKEIIDEVKKLKENIKKEAGLRLKEFTNSEKYKEILLSTIEEAMKKIENNQNTNIGITKNDMEKYGSLIYERYNSNISQIEDKYIGGCILKNEEQGIIIDNTLLNKINEKLKG